MEYSKGEESGDVNILKDIGGDNIFAHRDMGGEDILKDSCRWDI